MDYNILYMWAGGNYFEGEVIDVGVPIVRGAVGSQCHVGTVAGVGLQRGDVFAPFGAVAHMDGVHGDKGVDIVRVSHHAHSEYGVVVSVLGASPERELQGVDGIDVGIYIRQHDNPVVAVGVLRCGIVPVEALTAVGCVVVRTASHKRVEIHGGVVQAVPALNKVGAGFASSIYTFLPFKAHGVWEGCEGATCCRGSNR